MRLPNPCRISLRIPTFLTDWLREGLGWICGSRTRLPLLVVWVVNVEANRIDPLILIGLRCSSLLAVRRVGLIYQQRRRTARFYKFIRAGQELSANKPESTRLRLNA